MADLQTSVREPQWLADRRSHAAELAASLDLPQFKGTTGWEFTDLGAFDLSRFGTAPADAELSVPEPLFEIPGEGGASLTQVDGNSDAGEVSADGVIVKELPMEYAVEMNRLIELQMEGSIG